MSNDSDNSSPYEVLQSVVKSRQTLKVLADFGNPVEISKEICDTNRPRLLTAVRDAGWAPFHYARNHNSVPEPWRFYVLWHDSCRQIAGRFSDWFSDIKPGNKLPAMLNACSALVIVNWIPQPNLTETKEKSKQVNEEHLAATAAAVQNLLLLLTALGMGTYWSSGGQLRTPEMFRRLGIDGDERLLAAVFVEFPETQNRALKRIAGKHRECRGAPENWMKIIDVD